MTRIKLALIACAIVALVGIIVLRADRETSVDLVAAQAPTTYTVETVPETTTTTTRGWNQMTTDEWGFVNTWYAAENAPPPTTTVPPAAPKKVAPKAAAPKKATYNPGNYNTDGSCAVPAYICERESRGNYGAVNSSSGAGGKYQFMPKTWNATVQRMGRPDLVGVHPSQASPEDQNAAAAHLWNGGAGCAHWNAC